MQFFCFFTCLEHWSISLALLWYQSVSSSMEGVDVRNLSSSGASSYKKLSSSNKFWSSTALRSTWREGRVDFNLLSWFFFKVIQAEKQTNLVIVQYKVQTRKFKEKNHCSNHSTNTHCCMCFGNSMNLSSSSSDSESILHVVSCSS